MIILKLEPYEKENIVIHSAICIFSKRFGQESIINDVLEKFVENKISSMQEVIDIDDEQAKQLKEVELNFLLEVNSAENCWWCNTKKRIEKLETKKEEQLKDILRLDQFIKYDAIDKKKIKKHPIWMLD